VFCQVFNLLNARITEFGQNFFEGLFTNVYFWSLFVFIVLIQALIVEFGGAFFGCTSLAWNHWLWSVGFGSLELVVGAILRTLRASDDTQKRLIINREEKQQAMRRRYTGMTPSMMWRAPDAAAPAGDAKESTVVTP
jgi:Ca2+-transporting ATPase